MAYFSSLVTFCLFLSAASLFAAAPKIRARQSDLFATIPPGKELSWSPCYAANFFCALLDVPLDYSNPTGSRAYVPFLKYAAAPTTALPYKGAIITNPGGPGDSGVAALQLTAAYFQYYIGANYDLISFDPRGVGASIPLANCSASVASSIAPLERRFVDQLHGPHFGPQYFSNFYEAAQTLGAQCQSTVDGAGTIGPYMNSAVVAMDMISFLDAYASSTYSEGVTNTELLNYWGFSYGSFIGQVFANMFPDRVGRVILDAVIDAVANAKGYELNPIYMDEAFSTFFVYCNLAGASQCPYYTGSTSEDILARFESTVTKLDPVYAQLKGWANATVIELTLEAVKLFSYESSYYPIPLAKPPYPSFPSLAQFLLDVEAMLPNLTMASYQQLETNYELNVPGNPPEWARAVQCTDNANIYYGNSLPSFALHILLAKAQSYFLSGVSCTVPFTQPACGIASLNATDAPTRQIIGEYNNIALGCAGWSITGKGIYTGPFGGSTKNPILFVSNTRDPVLPLQNGQTGARIYDSAELLIVDGTGHTSPALFNTCAFGKISIFFQTGTLSASSNKCALEAGPWGIVATDTELKKRGLDEITKRVKGLIQTK